MADFPEFCGYINVTASRELFFYLAGPTQETSDGPIVLFLNGGPLCSSMIGALQENGPWRVSEDGASITRNPYGWNTGSAHVLFVDQPANGVGFSFGGNSSGDNASAEDMATFLESFVAQFPLTRTRPWVFSGESYAGVYVPLLANLVVQRNILNLRGILVGNGIMDRTVNSNTYFPFMAHHALFSSEITQNLFESCPGGQFSPSPSAKCTAAMNAIPEMLGPMFNAYDMYGSCASDGSTRYTLRWSAGGAGDGCVATRGITAYLNRADVKAALGVPASVTWTFCNDNGTYIRNYGTLMPEYASLVGKIAVGIYNGDADTVINAMGALENTRVLGQALGITQPWQPWYTADGQIAGFKQIYGKNPTAVSIITVKGAGHMVPMYKPMAALQMLNNFFLDNQIY